MFVTELSINYYAVSFINDEGCDKYTYYASRFLTGDRQRGILEDIRTVRENERL